MKRSLRTTVLVVSTFLLVGMVAGCSGGDSADAGSTPVAKVAPGKAAAGDASATSAPAVAGKATYLSDIPLAHDLTTVSPLNGAVKINGQEFQNATYANVSCQLSSTWDYDLNRSYKQMTATAGLGDGSPAEEKVKFSFRGDGKDLGSADVTLGVPVPVTVNLDGILRLQIQVDHAISNFCTPATQLGSYAALGDPSLIK